MKKKEILERIDHLGPDDECLAIFGFYDDFSDDLMRVEKDEIIREIERSGTIHDCMMEVIIKEGEKLLLKKGYGLAKPLIWLKQTILPDGAILDIEKEINTRWEIMKVLSISESAEVLKGVHHYYGRYIMTNNDGKWDLYYQPIS